jgi:hypothetical protein
VNTNPIEERDNQSKIIYYLLFSEEENLNKFLKKVLKSDFRLESESYYGDWETPFLVGVSALETTDESQVQTTIDLLSKTAQKLKGVYDSWVYDDREVIVQ